MNTAVLEAEKLIATISIPAQPQVVIDLQLAMASREPDFSQISAVVAKDIALSAKIIKLINSPFYGLSRPVVSISQALSLLGLNNFNNIVLSSAMREVIELDDALNERFWEHTLLMARLCEMVALRNGMISADLAYMVGLFHDCAVPLMLNRFPDYEDIAFPCLGGGKNAIAMEESRYSTNHAVVGYMVAKNWKLPDVVALAIRHHHEATLEHISDDVARTLTSTLVFSDFISMLADTSVSLSSEGDKIERWVQYNRHILIELGLNSDDIYEYREDAAELLIQSLV
ncbi:MAG: HDOD domain-containing protein [Gammaproteobacteria bacterium]|nr:HDOD domain-containing protein [Gammaproteobacteria bacterium]